MKIVANRIMTDWELKESNLPKTFHKTEIERELAISVGKKLLEMRPLFYEERRQDLQGTEYRLEVLVFNRDTLKKILLGIQKDYNISDIVMQATWLDIMNTI